MHPEGTRNRRAVSFQLYLQSFSGGTPAGFTRDVLRRAFVGLLEELEDDYWQADFGAAGRSDLFLSFLDDGSERIHCVSIEHPSADDRLWQAIWTLLGIPGVLFHFPGSTAPLARASGAGAEVPAGLRETLGQPIVIADAREILEAVMDHVIDRQLE